MCARLFAYVSVVTHFSVVVVVAAFCHSCFGEMQVARKRVEDQLLLATMGGWGGKIYFKVEMRDVCNFCLVFPTHSARSFFFVLLVSFAFMYYFPLLHYSGLLHLGLESVFP